MHRTSLSFAARPCIALDLGTANTRVYSALRDEMTEIPSCIHLVPRHAEAMTDEYVRHTNESLSVQPLRGGVIADLDNTVKLLGIIVRKSRRLFLAPAALATAPTDSTEYERGLLSKALHTAGASYVSVMPEVLAAAHGAGMDTTLQSAQMLIDLGDGVTDLAVFGSGKILYCSSLRTACSDLHRAVRSAIVMKYTVRLFDDGLERLTGSALSCMAERKDQSASFEMPGFDMLHRREVKCLIRVNDAVEAITPVAEKIVRMIETSLAGLPDNVYCSIIESGIVLTGGGACIPGLAGLIASRTRLDVRVAPDPSHAVIRGAAEILQYLKEQHNWWESVSWTHTRAAVTN